MKSQALAFRQIEWWTVTFIFLLMTIVNTLNFSYRSDDYLQAHLAKVLIPIILYVGFYLTHMKLVPDYLARKNTLALVGFGLLIAFATGLFTTLLTNTNPDISVIRFLRFYFNTMALYAAYLISVLLVRNILMPPKLRDFHFYNGVRLVLIFTFVTVFLFQGTNKIIDFTVPIIFSIALPIILAVVLYYYKLIYLNFEKGRKKAARWFLVLIMTLIFIPSFVIAVEDNAEPILLVGLGIIAFMLFILFPVSRLIFKKYDDYIGQISTLTNEVSVGSANLSFLRSQINPHFLFNALNTLYGAALMENAEKTSDGIQKLGDMMRFMLHENQMDKIPLTREIDYLRNYLDLQMLRFKNESNLEVEIKLSDEICEGSIAPMLLIPYVENAFKHGISTKSKSWIKINLRCLQGSIHLDVVNSIHPKKPIEDPRNESGIGLENVKSRLAHFYPQRHNLTIVANDTEHFVHLSVQLT